MTELLIIAISSALVSNVVLSQFLKRGPRALREEKKSGMIRILYEGR